MTDTFGDTLPVWIALTAVGAVALGAVLAIPGTPPPDATAVANAVSVVAAGEHAAARTIPVDASAVRVRPTALGLRNDAGAAHAPLPEVTPASTPALRRVLHGDPPLAVYPSPAAFRAAVADAGANATAAGWRPADGPLTVRHVVNGGVDVTLLG
ncbi:hypothetical protein EFA46_005935 [Halarchaeum sp. CBA1220]|uniref:DUF7283 family protein n=1 Tax=Halarchaeum sp. CBA1220 TaxID=1853682 RepID=UPI000F3A9D43|nr:hypothetical protein [Halarchaeum sp. CBA1220]QLC33755.1 hypothetical protein EFA46_005935 [Halarchaeum sp. CBA1220]